MGTVRGAASGAEQFHRHLQMDACTSVGISLNCPLHQTALLGEKFQAFKTTLSCFFLFRQPLFLHVLKVHATFQSSSNYFILFNPSAWGHLNRSSYCGVGRLFYGVFKLWSKLQRKK